MDVKIVRVDDRSLMQIGETQIEVADYNIKSSADGSTELSVTIKENAPTFELSASLESPKTNPIMVFPTEKDTESYSRERLENMKQIIKGGGHKMQERRIKQIQTDANGYVQVNISVNAEKEQKEKIYEAFEEFWKRVEKIVEEKA